MKIKKIPRWANIVFFRGPKGLAFINTIYLSDHFYELYVNDQTTVELEALIAHESEHNKRLHGLGRFGLTKYFLSRKFRLQEEIAATKVEIAVFKKNNQMFDYAGRARSWSSINYLFMVGYEEAYRILVAL
jgi:hypothetical protein